MNHEHADVTIDPATVPAESSECPPREDLPAVLPPCQPDDRPEVCVAKARLPDAVAAALAALARYNDPPVLFHHAGEPVKLVLADRQPPLLAPMRSADVQCELAYAARWFEQRADGTSHAIYPPAPVVHAVAGRLGQCLPPLRQVVRVPTFGQEWRLLDQPGYHAADQVYYHPDHGPLPPLAPHPDCDAVAEARRLICDELLGDFPFAGPGDRAAAVAALVLPFVRHRVDGATPLHVFDSPQPGRARRCWPTSCRSPRWARSRRRRPRSRTPTICASGSRRWPWPARASS